MTSRSTWKRFEAIMVDSNQNENALEPLSNERKLSHAEQIALCRYLAEFHTPAEAQAFLRKEFGKELAYQTIKGYSATNKWRPVISGFREAFTRGVMEVPISNKRMRLEFLDGLLRKATEEGNDALALRILVAAQKEIESPNWTPPEPFNEFSEMSDEQIAEEKVKVLEQMERNRKQGELLRRNTSNGP